MRIRSGAFAVPLSILFVSAADLGAQTDLAATLPADPSVTIDSLDNGLRYYIRANQRPENRAELRLVVNAGSILEDDDQRGLAHFVEHMAFNGTRNFAQQELVHYLESIGMRFGADLNAYTSFDETVYTLTVPTDREDAVETAFQILADWADGILFEPEEIEKERGVVIEEWRSRLGAGARLADSQYPVLLRDSRYAERLPIGRVEVLEAFPRDALLRFHDRWYRPDLMAVVAVGDFDVETIERHIREKFGPIARPDTPADRPAYPVPPHEETVFHFFTDPELTTTRIQVLHKQPPTEVATVGDYRDRLVARLYTAMLNDRFAEIVRKPDAPFVTASSGQGGLVRTADAYTLTALVADGGVSRGLAALMTEAERVVRYGFTQSELDRAKLNLLRALERAYAERARTNSGSFAGEYVRHFLSGEPIPGIEFEYEAARQLLPEISLVDVNRLATEWITEANRVVLVSGPRKDGAELPDETELRAVLASVATAEIEPYEDEIVEAPLLAAAPEGAPVVEEIVHDEVGVTEWRLANGVRVLLKPTDFRDDEILLRGYARGGLSLASDEDYLSASFATDVVRIGGVGDFNANELERLLAGKAASASPFIGQTDQGFTGTASPSDAETMFQLVYLYFTAPRRDPQAEQAILERLRAVLVNRDADPGAAFGDTLQLTLSQYHPRARPITVERLEEIDLERSISFYRERFDDAGDFTFAIVGNIDLATIRPLVERYLGGLPSIEGTETWRDNGVRPPGGVVEKIVRRGLEPRAQTRIIFTGEFEHTRENAHRLASLATIAEFRLRDVLREDLGGTYGAQVSASATREPEERYTISVAFGASPQRLDELVDVSFAEFERLRTDGPTDDEIARVKEIQRRSFETGMRQNGYWISQMIAFDREGRDLSEILTYEGLIDSLTADAVRDAARAWLRPDRYIRVSLVPENAEG